MSDFCHQSRSLTSTSNHIGEKGLPRRNPQVGILSMIVSRREFHWESNETCYILRPRGPYGHAASTLLDLTREQNVILRLDWLGCKKKHESRSSLNSRACCVPKPATGSTSRRVQFRDSFRVKNGSLLVSRRLVNRWDKPECTDSTLHKQASQAIALHFQRHIDFRLLLRA